jgi:hypothetical protein
MRARVAPQRTLLPGIRRIQVEITMLNIHVRNENRKLRLTWFVMEGARPQLLSRWSVRDSPHNSKAIQGALDEDRNQPVTKACDTETIAACVPNRPSGRWGNVRRIA